MREDDGLATSGDEPTPPELDALRRRLAELTADSDACATERAQRLSAFELDLLGFTARCAAADPSFGSRRGLPALAWAADWRDQAVEQELDAHAGADRLVEALIGDDALGWRLRAVEAAERGGAATCFEALFEATLLEREAVARRRGGAAHEMPIGARREPLRAALRTAIEAEGTGPAVRQGWAMQLADAADVVLTAVDDEDPQCAAVQLRLMEDDLSWYLRHVEADDVSRRRLRSKLRRLHRETQERELQGRLEHKFGATFVRAFDKAIVALIFVVLGILLIEVLFTRMQPDGTLESDIPFGVHVSLAVIDTLACLAFLVEFFVKLAYVRGRTSWFLRHFLIDLVPSVPVGLIALTMHAMQGGSVAGARLLRVWRLGRIFRLTRYARAIGFVARGFDRIGRRYGHLLNHNIVLYPNRHERRRAEEEAESLSSRVWRVRSRLNDEWRELLQAAPVELREVVARDRVEALESARQLGLTRSPPRVPGHAVASVRDIPAERMLRKLDSVTPAELEADLGADFVTRAARAVRAFARPSVRWFPVLRRYVPRVAPHLSDAEVTAAASHRIAKELRRHHDRWFWFADLYGTVTPSEFVDRVGTTMVRGSLRPAGRLALAGIGYLLVDAFIDLFEARQLDGLRRLLEEFLGPVIVVLGAVCLFVLGLGWWLKRLAGQATFFYEQTVNAQFLALTEAIKGRYVARDARLLDARVFGPEEVVRGDATPARAGERQRVFADAVRSWLVQARSDRDLGSLTSAMSRAILLYRDGQDGALFTESDNRTTSQLLGSPALLQMRGLSRRHDRADEARLYALDLARPRSSFRGPYLWFSFVSKAISQSVARLVVEYNRFAIPLEELPHAADRERLRYEAWVQAGKPPQGEGGREKLHLQRRGYITTAFTALHFLDDDPGRDREIADRFGEAVLANLQRDRRVLFREVFGTYPLHTRPRDQRVLNLYRTYERWFGGGRAFLIPLRVFWRWLKMIGRLLVWLARAVGEIRTPRKRGDVALVGDADFTTALRKIARMRDPVVWACILQRARFDAEYLGVRVPGAAETGMEHHAWEEDLEFLQAPGHLRRHIEREQARAEADVRRLARLVEDEGLRSRVARTIGVEVSRLSREHVRAATVAYRADFLGVRSLLSCQRILREAQAAVLDRPPLPVPLWPRLRLALAFRRWWKRYGGGGRPVRKGMWRAVVFDVDGARGALQAWGRHGPEAAFERGVAVLAELLRHPGRISEQLVTLRIIQTLALIDLRIYREHVYRLGDYAASGDAPGDLLDLPG